MSIVLRSGFRGGTGRADISLEVLSYIAFCLAWLGERPMYIGSVDDVWIAPQYPYLTLLAPAQTQVMI
jgi:hypothetical protein